MYKVVLIFALGLLSYNKTTPTNPESETNEIHQWVYWDAFSNTFNETADYWEAESAALEAEKLAEDRTDIKEFLENIEQKEENHQTCKS